MKKILKKVIPILIGAVIVYAIITTLIMTTLLIILTIASFLVWDSLFSLELILSTLRFSFVVAIIAGTAMMFYDWK